jgi:sulfur-oxidizing protein SoxZ
MSVARIQLPPQARRGEVIEVRIIIKHPMETGFRYDSFGRRTPRNVIRTLVCRYNGAVVFEGTLSSGIAANPYLRFFTRAVESGELEFSWIDDADVAGKLSAPITVTD